MSCSLPATRNSCRGRRRGGHFPRVLRRAHLARVSLSPYKERSFAMRSTKIFVCAAALLLAAAAAYAAAPDQPRMQAARADLQRARAELRNATADKGGHRNRALEHVNRAIDEVKKGVEYDRTH